MSAQFDINEYHGPNLYSSTLFTTETFFRNVDTADVYTNYPIPVPDTPGLPLTTNYSYETVVRLVCTQAPDNSVANFRIWKDYVSEDDDGGVLFFVGPTDSVFTPAKTNSSYADLACDGAQGNNLGNSWEWDNTTIITDVTHFTHYLVMQIDVTAAAVQGNDNRIFHFAYDES